jgi:CubicO group peptidase (beta-lactamase class C family)
MTKLATAVSLLQLVDQDKLRLDDDVRPIVPQLAAMQILRGFREDGTPILENNTRPISLRILLTHTLGLGYDLADPDLMKWSDSIGRTANNLQWTLEGFNTPIKFAPGDGWFYGAAYDWAGHLLTLVTGLSLEDYMQQHLFKPLGMTSTTFWPRRLPNWKARSLAFAIRDDDKSRLGPGQSPVPLDEHEMDSGGAGLFSTPEDYGNLLRGVLCGAILSPETTDLLFTPQLTPPQRDMLHAIADSVHDAFIPELARAARLDHGLGGGVLCMDDTEGKRRSGSLMWSGMGNGRWWIDRTTGIAGAVLTCVLPHGDAVVNKLWDEVERAVYDGLEKTH